jgi:hypothetical protein
VKYPLRQISTEALKQIAKGFFFAARYPRHSGLAQALLRLTLGQGDHTATKGFQQQRFAALLAAALNSASTSAS